ncbi:MAG TPA: hypothetical protein PKC39_10295 [Ferruginibacter sp.]|mgnify:CR=1 FL=1|nr:hypothetical protein [Ferruginibacter sp.]HMP21340.1 hypothetical protein [Ferruginibacter sp.]
MKYLLLIVLTALLYSCSDSFINHKLAFEKTGDCTNTVQPVKMLSNINGERYQLVSCLNADFDGTNYKVERNGDTLVVSFPKNGTAKAAFTLTLDIDAKPVYRYIIIDGHEIPIRQLY